MKIAVDVLSIREDGSAGGATGFAIELIKGVAAQKDIDVLVLCAAWNIDYLKRILPQGIGFYEVGGTSITGNILIDRVIRKINQRITKGNILQSHHVDLLFCPFSAPSCYEEGIPTVSTILDIQHEFYPAFFDATELKNRRRFYNNIVRKVERVICISDYTKQTFCDKYHFPLERADTVYIAIQNRFTSEDNTILDRLKIKNNDYIVYPANFWEHKNHNLLFNAFAIYAQTHQNLKLVLTGNTLGKDDYYQKVLQKLGIERQTVITGYVSNEELYSILNHAKGLIYPSLFEGFGIPVVEAMGLHKLIACSNLTSLPEIGCDSFYYFNPKKPDDILRGIGFLFENNMTEKIIKEYDEKLKEYEPNIMINKYLKIFRETLENKNKWVLEDSCEGIYPDNWSHSQIRIQIKDRVGETVQAVFSLPKFVSTGATLTVNNNGIKKRYPISYKKNLEIKEAITQKDTTITFTPSKIWSPSRKLKNDDTRTLGVMVERLDVVTAQDETISMMEIQ